MNHIYSVLWNAALGCFCVTSELGRSRSRATTQRRAFSPLLRPGLSVLATLVALAWAAPTWSQGLPQGHKVVSGEAQVTPPAGQQMNITQFTPNAILNWDSFNIGAGNTVEFVQPNASSVALNRVTGPEASAIYGSLQANGQVFLVNPNGVLFASDANVNVGGLVASTLNIRDQDFMEGRYQFTDLGSQVKGAEVLNQGTITAAERGTVALLGGQVSNQGTIVARLGSVALAAGNQVTLDFAGDGLLNVSVDQSAFKALATNSGLIEADGGIVLMTAQATDALLQTVVNNTGQIQAHSVANQQGKIVLLGDSVQVTGTLDASAPQGEYGDGGFIETRGAQVQVLADTHVTTAAAQGKTGVWHIATASDLTVSAGSDPKTDSGIEADSLKNSLAHTSITLQTLATGAGQGDIHIKAPVDWNKNRLTLSAHGDIHIHSIMTASGEAALSMNHGGDSPTQPSPTAGSGVHMAMDGSNFIGRVDFTDRDAANASADQLQINGKDYTLLTSIQAVQDIAQRLDGHYALAADIEAKDFKLRGYWPLTWGSDFKPIGASVDSPFTGKLQGLGHKISNLHIDRHDEPHVGLFGVSQGDISNIGMKGGSIQGTAIRKILSDTEDGQTPYVPVIETGAFAGRMNGGSLRNFYTTVKITGKAILDRWGIATHRYGAPPMAMTGGAFGHVKKGHIDNGRVNADVWSSANGKNPYDAYCAGGGAIGLMQQSASISNVDVQGRLVVQSRVHPAISNPDDGYLNRGLAWLYPSPPADPGFGISYAGGGIGDNHGGVVRNLTVNSTMAEITIHPNYKGSTYISVHAEIGSSAQATRSVTKGEGNAHIDVFARSALPLPEIAYHSLRKHSAETNTDVGAEPNPNVLLSKPAHPGVAPPYPHFIERATDGGAANSTIAANMTNSSILPSNLIGRKDLPANAPVNSTPAGIEQPFSPARNFLDVAPNLASIPAPLVIQPTVDRHTTRGDQGGGVISHEENLIGQDTTNAPVNSTPASIEQPFSPARNFFDMKSNVDTGSPAPAPQVNATTLPSTDVDYSAALVEPHQPTAHRVDSAMATAAPGLAQPGTPMPSTDSRLRMHSHPAYASATASAATTAGNAPQQTEKPVDEDAPYSVIGTAIRLPAR